MTRMPEPLSKFLPTICFVHLKHTWGRSLAAGKKMRCDYLSSVFVKHQAAQQRLFTQLPGFVSLHSKDFSHSCLVSEQLLRSNPSSTKHVALQIQFGTKHRRKILASHSAASGLRQDFFSRSLLLSQWTVLRSRSNPSSTMQCISQMQCSDDQRLVLQKKWWYRNQNCLIDDFSCKRWSLSLGEIAMHKFVAWPFVTALKKEAKQTDLR